MKERDYYAILQLNRGASADAIERAHERLSRIYDPATSRKPKAGIRYREIQDAYRVLGDRKLRLEYDRRLASGKAWLEPSEAETGFRGFVSRNYVYLGAGGIIASVLGALLLIILLGGGGNTNVVAQPSGSPTPKGQTPGATAPAKPPAVQGPEQTTADGLKYIDVKPGTGETPKAGETVIVNYSGWVADSGQKFDSSLDRGQPFTFALGKAQVIKGWDEGIATMKVGGTRRLIIPAALAYGAAGHPPEIPANATLIFDVDLLRIAPAATPSPAVSPSP